MKNKKRELDAEGTTEGFKKDLGKPRMDLLPPRAMEGIAKVFTVGSKKYDPSVEVHSNNWRQGMRWNRIVAAMMRHLTAWQKGEDLDPETGLPHVDHMGANAMMLAELIRTFPQGDDRALPWRRLVRVGLDLDGVICNTYDFLTKRMKEMGVDGPWGNEMPHYAFGEHGVAALNSITKEEWLEMPPLVSGTELNFEPQVYVTARKGVSARVAEEWLQRHGFPAAPVVFTGDRNKGDVLDEYGITVFVDDKYKNFVEINAVDGVVCYLLDQPYNRKHEVGHLRINSVNELKERGIL